MTEYWWHDCITVGGYDIGKRSNPSHCSVLAIKENEDGIQVLIQIHQKFLDGWEYSAQIEYLKDCIEYFGIQKMYCDNTRGEFEERGLPRQAIPISLSARTGKTAKGKVELATNFAKLVEQKRIRLLDDDRFISQILCVTNDLRAPETPLGHGDAFISIILAVGAYQDYFAKDRGKGTTYLGDLQEILAEKPVTSSYNNHICKICRGRTFDILDSGKKRCKTCLTIW